MSKFFEQLKKQRLNRIIKLDTNDNSLIKSKLNTYTCSIDKIEDLGFKDDKYIKSVSYTYFLPISYENLVNKLIREKYSDSDEYAILRKSINNPSNSEFTNYYVYAEQCKSVAKEWIEERDKECL